MSRMDGILRFHGWKGAGHVLFAAFSRPLQHYELSCWSLIEDEAMTSFAAFSRPLLQSVYSLP